MYTAYFSLSEAPFSISPNPAYLFMSERHKEALAHLTYGLGEHGGFVLLTGEVGTGKTTISRSVMEQLPENTQAAIILNPTLSCDELLATICDNLKVRYRKTGATLTYLTDKIQDKLIKNHQQGINTLLIIDEAQHLLPEVLEQLRLLTNLETNTKKLLQVILIGQPELQQLLQRRDLRQLAQRITARYHLLPLTKSELHQYIEHRLSVAQCTTKIFNKRAVAMIHNISGGIPRLVNLLCDRSLIVAYNHNQSVVNRKIVINAANEVLVPDFSQQNKWAKPTAIAAGFIFVLAIGYLVTMGVSIQVKEPTAVSESVNPVQPLNESQQVEPRQDQIASQLDIMEQLTAQTNETNNTNASSETKNVTENIEEPLVLGYQPEQQLPNSEFEIFASEGVSKELLEQFKQAVAETDNLDAQELEKNYNSLLHEDNMLPIHELDLSLQEALPPLAFEMHIYATEGQGWVRVNGEDRREGEQIASEVWLEKILPQKVILSFREQSFSMPALSNW